MKRETLANIVVRIRGERIKGRERERRGDGRGRSEKERALGLSRPDSIRNWARICSDFTPSSLARSLLLAYSWLVSLSLSLGSLSLPP